MPKTIVKDQATAEFAARNLDKGAELPGQASEPNAPKTKSTSEKLFPEFVTDDGAVINRPIKPYEDSAKVLPASATPAPATQPLTPPTTTPTAPVYVTESDLKGKMAKLKVDGIETDVPAESLIKTNQLERHLNAQLINLADERRKLELERSSLRAPAPAPEPMKPTGKEPVKSQEVIAMEIRLAQMQAQMEGLQASLVPQIQEAGKKRVANMVKEKLGADDFDSYFDRIRDGAILELAKPEIANNPQARQMLDSPNYYFEQYKEMKLRDLMAKASAPVIPQNSNAPALMTNAGAPVILTNQGRVVSMPTIESSGGVPSRSDSNGDWAAKAQQAFDLARQTGRTEDWVVYYKLKGQGS